MNRLTALIWKSYKLRARSFLTTSLDLLAPILVIALYTVLKIAINMTHEVQIDPTMSRVQYFSGTSRRQINLRQDIKHYMCPTVLYHSKVDDDGAFSTYLTEQCGLKLERVPFRSRLVRILRKSLDVRIAFQNASMDLTKTNLPKDNCIRLPLQRDTMTTDNSSTMDIYHQIGIVRSSSHEFEIHATDMAGSSVIHVPYTQGSSYNEYKLPNSDLNLGIYLIEICLTNAFKQATIHANRTSVRTESTTSTTNASTTNGRLTTANSTAATSTTTATATTTTTTTTTTFSTRRGISTATSRNSSDPQLINNQAHNSRSSFVDNHYSTTARSAVSAVEFDNIKLYIEPYPTVTGVFLLPILTVLFIMVSSLFSALAILLRITDANENGTHRYLRLSGLPSGLCYLSELILQTITSLVQSLILALMLSLSNGQYLYDPISESAITVRWMLIFTYSFSVAVHSIFFASLFDSRASAVLTLMALATAYSMQPLWLILQWTPYGFIRFRFLTWLYMLTPCASFQALCGVIISVTMQNNEQFNWSHLSETIINGGISNLSAGSLWALMIAQSIFWLVMTILIDQFRYSVRSNALGFAMAQANELFCCNTLGYQHERAGDYSVRSRSIKSVYKSMPSQKDPNRICCSLRGLDVDGPVKLVPYSKGNPLIMQRKQQKQDTKLEGKEALSKTAQFIVNWKHERQSSSSPVPNANMLDVAIGHNIAWYETTIKLENLSLDFRFNQVTFVLGQTALKELLFQTLLGLRSVNHGFIYLDGVRYLPSTMSLARRHMGHLGDRDVFYQELSIFENLQLFGSLRDPHYTKFDSESLYVLTLLHLNQRRNEMPATLTQHAARKLALAVAIVGYTKMLLLTEPTLNLKWRPKCQVYNLLRKYKSIRSIVVDSSDIDEAVAFGDKIVLLKDGNTDLSDEPKRLIRKLGCGYRLVFEPTQQTGKANQQISPEAMRALTKVTTDLFKQDKIDMDATKRSVYQDHQEAGGISETLMDKSKIFPRSPLKNGNTTSLSPSLATGATKASATAKSIKPENDLLKPIVVVKIRHTSHSERGLCNLLKLYNNPNNTIHGLHLVQVNYESLEDILVMRMSRAIYPDLPPDLLLSLQHRAHTSHKTTRKPTSMSVSVRSAQPQQQSTTNALTNTKLPSPSPSTSSSSSTSTVVAPQSQPQSSIFDSSILTIIKDRFSQRSELILLLASLLVSIVIVAITLLSLKYSLMPDDDRRQPPPSPPPSTKAPKQQETPHPPVFLSLFELQQASNDRRLSRTVSFLEHSSNHQPHSYHGAPLQRNRRQYDQNRDASYDLVNDDPDRLILNHTMIDRLYRYRIGFYILQRGALGCHHHHHRHHNDDYHHEDHCPTHKEDCEVGEVNNNIINGNMSQINRILLQFWPGNHNLVGEISLSSNNKTDSQIVASLVHKSKDLAGSLIIYDPQSNETIIIFEPHLPHMLLATIRAFLDFTSVAADAIRPANVTAQSGLSREQKNISRAGLWPNPSSTSSLSSSSMSTTTSFSSRSLLSEPTSLSALSSSLSSRVALQQSSDNATNDKIPGNRQVDISPISTSRFNFRQSWHNMIQGYPTRRLIYGIGIALAEAISIGFLAVAPLRHRRQASSNALYQSVGISYWLKMAAVDLALSLVLILSYLILFITIEGLTSGNLIMSVLLVFAIYKLASLPVPYLVSMVADTRQKAFLTVFTLTMIVAWDMAIFMKSYIDWTIIGNGISYIIATWLAFVYPIASLIESLVIINQINSINMLCPRVPAFAPTNHTVELNGIHKYTVVDGLLSKIHECLKNGKTSIDTDVFHADDLGVLWYTYLMVVFGIIMWAFLLSCERLFGTFFRRNGLNKIASDPMKTVVRTTNSDSNQFVWDEERERLISEYIRCLNETSYAKKMAKNCLMVRIWLRPFDNQVTAEGRMSEIIGPIMGLGYSKNEIHFELRTTLQLFIRLGDETKACRLSKIQLIEAYARYLTAHNDIVSKFAIIDWTRENLYKILLHGHYNNKTALS